MATGDTAEALAAGQEAYKAIRFVLHEVSTARLKQSQDELAASTPDQQPGPVMRPLPRGPFGD